MVPHGRPPGPTGDPRRYWPAGRLRRLTTPWRRLLGGGAFRGSELLHVSALWRREVEERVREALVDLGLAEDDLVHVALRVRHHAREHLPVLADDEEQLGDARDRLHRRQFERLAFGQPLGLRRRLGRELLQEIALAPEEGEGAGELVAAEVALHLRFLIVGPPDPQRLALHEHRAA